MSLAMASLDEQLSNAPIFRWIRFVNLEILGTCFHCKDENVPIYVLVQLTVKGLKQTSPVVWASRCGTPPSRVSRNGNPGTHLNHPLPYRYRWSRSWRGRSQLKREPWLWLVANRYSRTVGTNFSCPVYVVFLYQCFCYLLTLLILIISIRLPSDRQCADSGMAIGQQKRYPDEKSAEKINKTNYVYELFSRFLLQEQNHPTSVGTKPPFVVYQGLGSIVCLASALLACFICMWRFWSMTYSEGHVDWRMMHYPLVPPSVLCCLPSMEADSRHVILGTYWLFVFFHYFLTPLLLSTFRVFSLFQLAF